MDIKQILNAKILSDFQDFNEPTYTEVLQLALEEAEASIK